MKHYEEEAVVQAAPEALFAYVDDYAHLSSHMSQSSWMMGGGSMKTETDEGMGQKIGSHIQLSGKAFGIGLFLDEVVTQREPPRRKVWETVGTPKLLVIGNYRMGFEISGGKDTSRLRVFIDYEPLKTVLGYLFGSVYAKWCVRQMIGGVRKQFKKPES